MSDKEERKVEGNIQIDLGFGNLFKGLGNFLDVVSDLVEKAEEIKEKSGEFTAGTSESGQPIRGMYGFRIGTMSSRGGSMPKVETFGNIRETERGPVVTDTWEPIVDVFDENGSVLIVAELPGVAGSEIEASADGDILSLTTMGKRRYAKEILLPAAVDPATLTSAMTNGILEIRVQKQKPAGEDAAQA